PAARIGRQEVERLFDLGEDLVAAEQANPRGRELDSERCAFEQAADRHDDVGVRLDIEGRRDLPRAVREERHRRARAEPALLLRNTETTELEQRLGGEAEPLA